MCAWPNMSVFPCISPPTLTATLGQTWSSGHSVTPCVCPGLVNNSGLLAEPSTPTLPRSLPCAPGLPPSLCSGVLARKLGGPGQAGRGRQTSSLQVHRCWGFLEARKLVGVNTPGLRCLPRGRKADKNTEGQACGHQGWSALRGHPVCLSPHSCFLKPPRTLLSGTWCPHPITQL